METLLLKASTANGDEYEAEFSFSKHNTGKMLRYRGATWATKYYGSYVKGGEDIMFWRNLLAVLKFPEPEKKLIQEVQTICKLLALNPITSAAGEGSFSSVPRTTSEDVVSIQDGWWEV